MPIEPHHARTVYTPTVMPPKVQAELKRPAMTLEEDAARIRARFYRNSINPHIIGDEAQAHGAKGGRSSEQMQKAAAYRKRITDIMTRALCVAEIAAKLGESEKRIRWAVKVLIERGEVKAIGKERRTTNRPQTVYARTSKTAKPAV